MAMYSILRLICSVLLPSGYVRVIQLVCLNLLPRGYVEAAQVLKIRSKSKVNFSLIKVNFSIVRVNLGLSSTAVSDKLHASQG